MTLGKAFLAMAAATCACTMGAEGEEGADESMGELGQLDQLCRQGPVRLQAGSLLGVLATTASRWVVYQDGLTIYATTLSPGAPRVLLAEATVPNIETMVDGDTVMLWPDQTAFTPSVPGRLVVWRPGSAPRQLATRTVVPTSTAFPAGVAASPDGRQVLFLDNLDEAGTRADVVYSGVTGARTVIARQVDADYANPVCPPYLGFRAQHAGDARAQPLAAYCQDGVTGATLATVDGAAPRVLAAGLRSAATVQARAGLVTALTSNLEPISISRSGQLTTLDADSSRLLFPADNGEVLSYAVDASGASQLKRLDPRRPGWQRTVGQLSLVGFAPSHLPIGGHPYYTDNILAYRDRGMMAWTNSSTGALEMQLVDPRGEQASVTLGSGLTCGPSYEPFTRDGHHALLYCLDATAGYFSLTTASYGEAPHVVSSGATAFQHFGLGGGRILYADNVAATATGAAFDLKVVDLRQPTAQTTLVAGAATNFVITPDARYVVYSREDDAEHAGLYVERVR